MLQAGYRASAACARARPEHALVSGMFSGIPGRRPLNRDFTGKSGILGRYELYNNYTTFMIFCHF